MIKLFLQEQDSELATALFAASTPEHVPPYARVIRAAPDLLYLECANILRTRVHRGLLAAAEAGALAAQLAALPIAWYATPPLLTAIIGHALTRQISAYDAAYVALAALLHLPLITADGVLAGKLIDAGIEVFDLSRFR